MKHLKSSDIRQMFVDFFKKKGHDIEPSASLVPQDDPTLLWINSGVATLKKYFDGRVVPDNPRIVNVQKAIRTNDIENVGFTARHHTFFEMLGNFSIGDYFKQEAIQLAWEFLTSDEWIGFDQDLLSVTVHPEDDEAYNIWLNEIGLPAYRIIRLEENFWDIGEGPSGPNTEIFYDRGETYGNNPDDPELYPGGENGRYLEIWNLVFSQFNHNPDDTYTPLPSKNIDTGLGLERLVSVIQDVPTNYETDLFMPIIKATESVSKKTYGDNETDDTAFKVIADHIRTVSFALGDNALPSNEGRGYVLRRLIRRAVRFAKQININEPFMYRLVPVVGEIMKDFYPQVIRHADHIQAVIQKEEERFHETLEDGLAILNQIIQREKEKGMTIFPGEDVFLLSDTYGFPKELTEEYLYEEGFTIDESGFEQELEKQRERARQARGKVDSMQIQNESLATAEIQTQFIGYDTLKTQTSITGLFNGEVFVESATAGQEVYLFLKNTPFYAESGGQVADAGTINSDDASARILDVQQAPKGEHIHKVRVENGVLTLGLDVTATVEPEFRGDIIKNHTATHLLHQALKDILGSHVNQAGSLVTPEKLRFDFSHFNAVTQDQLTEIEHAVNEQIFSGIDVTIESMPLETAKQKGALALFGEKYGDTVRVVEVGNYSTELCGGCHVGNTSDIGLFKLTMETGVGTGTRRIEAVTSKYAYQFINSKLQILNDVSTLLKVRQDKIPERLETMFQDMRHQEKEIESLSAKLSHMEAESILNQVEEVDGVPLLTQKVDVKNMNQLRNMVDELKQKLSSGVILLASEAEGKAQFAAGVSRDLIEQRGLHAGNIIKQAATITGGGGGGRPDMAQAGGKQPEKIGEALQSVKTLIKETITD